MRKHMTIFLFLWLIVTGDTLWAAPAMSVQRPPGAVPWTWPKTLVELPVNTRVQYRNTRFSLEIRTGKRPDDDEDIILYEVGVQAGLPFSTPPGVYCILDLDSPRPILAKWGARFDGLVIRWLMAPATRGDLRFEIVYLEVYTLKPSEALMADPTGTSNRLGQGPRSYYFYGYFNELRPASADRQLEKILNLQTTKTPESKPGAASLPPTSPAGKQ